MPAGSGADAGVQKPKSLAWPCFFVVSVQFGSNGLIGARDDEGALPPPAYFETYSTFRLFGEKTK